MASRARASLYSPPVNPNRSGADAGRALKPEVVALRRIQDRMDDRENYLLLDKNESLHPFGAPLLADLHRALLDETFRLYPELGPLYDRIAASLGVAPNRILLAAGADIAIRSVFEACFTGGDAAVVHLPCYAMTRIYAHMFGGDTRGVPVRDDWSTDLDGMLRAIDDRTKIVVVESPNGFVGTWPDPAGLERLAGACDRRGVILVVDETYAFFERDGRASIPLTDRHPHVVVVQSLSKVHGLAGARIGYLVGHPALVGQIAKVRPMHEVAGPTAAAAAVVLAHPEHLEEVRTAVRESKDMLLGALPALGVEARDTAANFLLLRLPEGVDVVPRLRKRRILVRRPFEEPFLRGWTRVTVPDPPEARRFLEALRAALAEAPGA